ncbi:hypothetical protein [Bacillus sp. EB600]|uniref:hypothetical protein n=1 Tax=Bacillus sp. EB600 TaxID=2806345 RepID=UPI00210DB449|nr:hypothetical protein [Bacillus sp. EB600]MCQ6280896.1 hypothetical protein [Bacillus sp. EB600]
MPALTERRRLPWTAGSWRGLDSLPDGMTWESSRQPFLLGSGGDYSLFDNF